MTTQLFRRGECVNVRSIFPDDGIWLTHVRVIEDTGGHHIYVTRHEYDKLTPDVEAANHWKVHRNRVCPIDSKEEKS